MRTFFFTIFIASVSTQLSTVEEGSGDIEILAPSATLTKLTADSLDAHDDRPYPPSPRDRCGTWSSWKKVKCWWPDMSFDSLPTECTNFTLPSKLPTYVKKFVDAKEQERYAQIVNEYKLRGSPAKCGYCSKSFECRARNATARPWCKNQEIRPFNASCDDKKACRVSLVNEACPLPMFMNKNRIEKVNDQIEDGDMEGALQSLFYMGNPHKLDEFEGWDRKKRQTYWDGNQEDLNGNGFNWNGRGRQDRQGQKKQFWGQQTYEQFQQNVPLRTQQYDPQFRDQYSPYYDQGPQYRQPSSLHRQQYDSFYYQRPQYRHQGPQRRRQYDTPYDQGFEYIRSGSPRRPQYDSFYDQGRQYNNGYMRGQYPHPYYGYQDGYNAQQYYQGYSQPRVQERYKYQERSEETDYGKSAHQIRPDYVSEDFWPGRTMQKGYLDGDMDLSTERILIVGVKMANKNDQSRIESKIEQLKFLGGLLHGTNCASTGSECLCCCGGYIPDMETKDCKNLRNMIPGLDEVFGDLAQSEDFDFSTLESSPDSSDDLSHNEESVVSSTATL